METRLTLVKEYQQDEITRMLATNYTRIFMTASYAVR